jgi:hypothetical protein
MVGFTASLSLGWYLAVNDLTIVDGACALCALRVVTGHRSALNQPEQIAPEHCQVVEKIEDRESAVIPRRFCCRGDAAENNVH